MERRYSLYLGAIIFGITDSLVSTVGLLAGITAGGASARFIILTGVVYTVVEAFSMAVGNFLSEKSTEEYDHAAGASDALPIFVGVIMFFSFIIASLIPLAPYFFLAPGSALPISIIASVLALFAGGVLGARVSRLPMFWRGVRMAVLGGAAIALGLFIGRFFPGA